MELEVWIKVYIVYFGKLFSFFRFSFIIDKIGMVNIMFSLMGEDKMG